MQVFKDPREMLETKMIVHGYLGKASKKKLRTWDIVPTGGEGVRHPKLNVPTSLDILTPKLS